MIYEILTTDIPNALYSNCRLIIISNDSQRALVYSENAIEAIEQYDELLLDTLLTQVKWRQPCMDCEV